MRATRGCEIGMAEFSLISRTSKPSTVLDMWRKSRGEVHGEDFHALAHKNALNHIATLWHPSTKFAKVIDMDMDLEHIARDQNSC